MRNNLLIIKLPANLLRISCIGVQGVEFLLRNTHFKGVFLYKTKPRYTPISNYLQG